MLSKKKIIAILCAYNEEGKIGSAISKIPKFTDCILVVDDGSTDNTANEIRESFSKVENIKTHLIQNPVNKGVGCALRSAMAYAVDEKYDFVYIFGGDDQYDPDDIIKLVQPLLKGYDLVKGSRYLEIKQKIPLFRKLTTKMFSLFFNLATGSKITDASEGLRAFKIKVATEIDFTPSYLDRYELEPYMLIEAVKKGYKILEVPIDKIYDVEKGYSKMVPLVSWYSITKPILREILRLNWK
ncbi:MAG: glycosyltransferase family 2 protein [Methanobacteriota archaeon]